MSWELLLLEICTLIHHIRKAFSKLHFYTVAKQCTVDYANANLQIMQCCQLDSAQLAPYKNTQNIKVV